MDTLVGDRPRPGIAGWAWFAAWMPVGVGVALLVSVIGLFTVPVAAVAVLLLWLNSDARRSAFGLVSGAGLVPLFVRLSEP